jgi:hypothetical protein
MSRRSKPGTRRWTVLACVAVIAVVAVVTRPAWTDALRAHPAGGPAATASEAADSELASLLNEGQPGKDTSGYYLPSSPDLVAAAAGADNQRFYQLGRLLVRDGFGNAIINLSREMNGSWYAWNERHAPSSEPDAFIRAWRQVVTAMRSVPGAHFKFLWTIYPGGAAAAECWPGSAYVDYVGTDVFDWYGGPGNTYPHTASGALDWALHWQRTLTATPGGLDWTAQFSKLTGKPIMVPEWGLDFHTFGGQDDTYFLTRMTAWLKDNHAIGLYWVQGHVTPSGWPGGPLLADQGASAQTNTPGAVNAMGMLLGGHLRYAAVYLGDRQAVTDATAQPVLALWEKGRYRLVLGVDIIPNPPVIKSYSGPPEPGERPYRLSDYPDAVAVLRRAR